MLDILDELDTISRIQADEVEEDRQGPKATSVEGRESVIPPVEACHAKESYAEAKDMKVNRAKVIEFYGGGSEKTNNREDAEEAEVVFH